MGAIGGVDGGECDKTVNFGTWPSEVDNLKARLLVAAEAVDRGVESCPELAKNERASWLDFMTEFRRFATTSTGLFGSYNEWTQACSYAHTIDAWHEKLSATCNLPGPVPGKVKGADTTGATVLMWIAGAVIAVAVVVGVKQFIPSSLWRK